MTPNKQLTLIRRTPSEGSHQKNRPHKQNTPHWKEGPYWPAYPSCMSLKDQPIYWAFVYYSLPLITNIYKINMTVLQVCRHIPLIVLFLKHYRVHTVKWQEGFNFVMQIRVVNEPNPYWVNYRSNLLHWPSKVKCAVKITRSRRTECPFAGLVSGEWEGLEKLFHLSSLCLCYGCDKCALVFTQTPPKWHYYVPLATLVQMLHTYP
jgi:hypothetical protein